jgi:hypothetical protein
MKTWLRGYIKMEQKVYSDHETLDIGDEAVGFNTANYSNEKVKEVFVTCEVAPIRWKADGTDPTLEDGHLLGVGDSRTIEGNPTIRKFRAIKSREGGQNGVLHCSFIITLG